MSPCEPSRENLRAAVLLQRRPPSPTKTARAVNQFQLTDLIIVLFLSLVAGYFVVSFLIPERVWKNLRKRSRFSNPIREADNRPGSHRPDGEQPPRTVPGDVESPTERDHARALGLSGRVTLHQIKIAYRNEIAKYHPDKVNHLAPEFQELARERTRRIRNAYEYFRTKYKL